MEFNDVVKLMGDRVSLIQTTEDGKKYTVAVSTAFFESPEIPNSTERVAALKCLFQLAFENGITETQTKQAVRMYNTAYDAIDEEAKQRRQKNESFENRLNKLFREAMQGKQQA